MNTVPHEFWYATCLILASILIWIIQKYFNSLEKTTDELKKNVTKLTTMVELHDADIKRHDRMFENFIKATKR